MNAIELIESLRLHKLWRAGDPVGARADLSDADLSRADLSRVAMADIRKCAEEAT